jgi:1,2-beta-oligoglucan phosphorylase
MMRNVDRVCTTPRDGDLGLRVVASAAGLAVSVLPNGGLFAIEHQHDRGRIMLNLVLGSPLDGGIGRLYLRIGGAEPRIVRIGPGGRGRFGFGGSGPLGATGDRVVWDGESLGLRHRVTLWLHARSNVWLWHVELANRGAAELPCDAILVQDLGLGGRGFLMNNEAYVSQYIDHHIAADPQLGPVVMCRQNQAQGGKHPWVALGCLDGAAAFATDALQIFGPAFRDAESIGCALGTDLPNQRQQHEVACPALQSRAFVLKPGESATRTYFGLYEPDHAAASSDADLARIDAVQTARQAFAPIEVPLAEPVRSILQDAPPAAAERLSDDAIARRYPERRHEERRAGALLSFFTPDGRHNRHVVLRDKERLVPRRHGTLLRSGAAMLLDDATLCATGWMQGVFGAQLTIGNTSFHKLFSVSRDPYNITRASGLRILIDSGGGWRLLAVPSAFEIGLNDCRWLYRCDDRTVSVRAVAAGDDPALQWEIAVDGAPCRFLVFGHAVLGEREYENGGSIAIDATRKRFTFLPNPDWLWGQRYPDAAYHLVSSTPDAIEAIGCDDLLYADGQPRHGAYVAVRTRATNRFRLAVVGSMTDAAAAEALAEKYSRGVDAPSMLAPAARFWEHLTRGLRLGGGHPDLAALDTFFPWLAHNAMMHLTVPHGLEQYTGAAWGTRDVCQGPVELLLSLEHDAPVKEILRIVFAQQYETRGDWPQWFMLEPYSNIQDRHSHGDVIVWPLKALCDYLEWTGDLAFLDEPAAWRREDNLQRTERKEPIAAHIDKLVATVRERFIPGTSLIRYGEGDWNDSLQPADPKMRDWMVSSWTVALLFQQVDRYAQLLQGVGRDDAAKDLAALAAAMRADFNRHLVIDGTVAGYVLFSASGGTAEPMLHPRDTRTGIHYSLLPMTRSIIAGLFTPEQAQHHLQLIRAHLLHPDGVRLMDRPATYRGGLERVFRRAESAAFFGREIGLMYIHAHLRYGEALAALGEVDALWEALLLANPIAVTERLAHASPRQRNAYFSSSDAAFRDRYEAGEEWERVKNGRIAVDGGWRIYSSGPGLYANLLLRHALGLRRQFGTRSAAPLLPRALGEATLEMDLDDRRQRWTFPPP